MTIRFLQHQATRTLGLIALFLLLSLPHFCWACSCGIPEMEVALGGSDLVVAGTVDAVREINGNRGTLVSFKVAQRWKGPELDRVDLLAGRTSCDFRFKKDQKWLLFARLEGSFYIAGLCSRSKSLESAKDDLTYLNRIRSKGGNLYSHVLPTRSGRRFPRDYEDLLNAAVRKGDAKRLRQLAVEQNPALKSEDHLSSFKPLGACDQKKRVVHLAEGELMSGDDFDPESGSEPTFDTHPVLLFFDNEFELIGVWEGEEFRNLILLPGKSTQKGSLCKLARIASEDASDPIRIQEPMLVDFSEHEPASNVTIDGRNYKIP